MDHDKPKHRRAKQIMMARLQRTRAFYDLSVDAMMNLNDNRRETAFRCKGVYRKPDWCAPSSAARGREQGGPFTDFDPADNIAFSEVRAQKDRPPRASPVGKCDAQSGRARENLAWQERGGSERVHHHAVFAASAARWGNESEC